MRPDWLIMFPLLLSMLLGPGGAVGQIQAQATTGPEAGPTVTIRNMKDAGEAERLLRKTLTMSPARRVAFISASFLGRKYHPDTKKRIGAQRKPAKPKTEAVNVDPLPVPALRTDFQYLDCMTYVEHVLALAACDRPDYRRGFLPRLLDIMFDAHGGPLFSHLRNHFTSAWAVANERKGYLTDVARGHPLAATRSVLLNRVGDNRTFYVEDRFMIAAQPQPVHFFPTETILAGKAPLESGDVLALVCDKEGLDVTHMGFFILKGRKRVFRHASLTRNRVVDQDFDTYFREKKNLTGLMVLRPRLAAAPPPSYLFVTPATPK